MPRVAATCAATLALAGSAAIAQTWRVETSIGLVETLTNNVNLAPDATRKSDLVTQLTPGISVTEKSARTTFSGDLSLPIVWYARTGNDNNNVYPVAHLLGNVEAVERFFFIEGEVSVSQQYFTPFGARPDNLVNATNNRYTSQSYRVTPYIKGEMPGNIRYNLRDDNIWTNLSSTPVQANGAYTNVLAGNLTRDPAPFGWGADYNRSDVRFKDQAAQVMQLARLRMLYVPDPVLELGVSTGYERNDFLLTDYNSAIYGASAKWRPNERTSADGFWEHRFFGGSYGFTADYRTPLSVWGVRASRNITTYPQTLATLPSGANVPNLLNELLSSRIVDPTERQRLVDQLIHDRGLPETLSGAVSLYTQQITLQQSASVTMGLLGARNSVLFSVYHVRNEPVAGSGNPLPSLLVGADNNAQTGASAAWSHQLMPLITVGASVDWSRTVAISGFTGTTNQGSIRAILNANLSQRTSAFAGARYQIFRSDVSDGYREAAIFAGLTHTFR